MEQLKELFSKLFSIILGLLEGILDRFLRLNIFDRILVLLVIPSFLAVIKPVARFYIYETWYYINNPMAENLIGIVLLCAATFYLPSLFAVILRAVPSGLYLIWTIYMQASHTISRVKAPYELTPWQYLNFAVPAAIIVFSLLSYFFFEKDRG